ncbi:MAG: flagellar basal-body rod protein FlgG [Comamonadaceae bacterium]|jgi:flagellar basal-body rod protein FlgG|nr:flagellar basal-body rod protein FlgG [Comamonadaceae bacterium]
MDASMWVAKTGLDAQQTRMNVISNNLANVNTTGYKRDRAVFEDMLYQNVRQPGGRTDANSQAPTGLMLGTGVRVVATEKIHAQGNMMTTQNPLDMAIAGGGFFQIAQADGSIAYTRDGGFKLSATGQIVTSSGALLQPAITVPANASALTVGRDGTVSIELTGGGNQVLGQIQVARFVNPSGLQSLGQNLLKETPASGPPQVLVPGLGGAGSIVQGAMEASNVNVVEEMVSMIETQRAYEINSKAISAVDGMLKFINNNL